MKKGVVEPVNRWDTLPRSAVKYSPETERFLWIARVVDLFEDEGRMKYFKAEGSKYNPIQRSYSRRELYGSLRFDAPNEGDSFLPARHSCSPHVLREALKAELTCPLA